MLVASKSVSAEGRRALLFNVQRSLQCITRVQEA